MPPRIHTYPGRPALPAPPTIFKGPDPHAPPAPRQSSPGTPAETPKVPHKEEIRPLNPLLQGSIEIFRIGPNIGTGRLSVENRQGSPRTKEQNADLSDPARRIGGVIFGSRFKQIGGPGEDRGKKYSEYHLRNWDTRNQRPRTTKGNSYTDASFESSCPRKMRMGIPDTSTFTWTPSRRPGGRESRTRENKGSTTSSCTTSEATLLSFACRNSAKTKHWISSPGTTTSGT